VQTVPFAINAFAGPAQDSLMPTIALEANAGAPRGLAQNWHEHDRLMHLADSLDLALVAGSDNHGWGRTAAAWTLVRLPGWRAMSPDSLAIRLEDVMRRERRTGTRVVERRTPEIDVGAGLVLTVPLALYELNATLSPSQRLSWICWIWGIAHLGPLAAAWWRGKKITREVNA
jgi:hypothetical protein